MAQATVDARPLARDRRTITRRQVTLALIAVGIILRVVAYAADPTLWLDEILLARNIIDLPLGALLTEPLGLDQVAPRGFLVIERLAVLAFGPGELALRLFPFRLIGSIAHQRRSPTSSSTVNPGTSSTYGRSRKSW